MLRLIRHVLDEDGWQRFVTGPIFIPSDGIVPHCPATAEDVGRSLSRLFAFAGLPGPIRILDQREPSVPTPWRKTIVDFVEVDEQGFFIFEFHHSSSSSVEILSVLAHQVGLACQAWKRTKVAHPFRTMAMIPGQATRGDDALALVYGLHRGLGAIVLAGAPLGAMTSVIDEKSTEQAVESVGVETLAYLLAVQVAVRQDMRPAIRWLDRVAPDQAAILFASRKRIDATRSDLLEQLNLPPEETWPAWAPPTNQVVRWQALEHREVPVRHFNAGSRVFRMRRSAAASGIAIGAIATTLSSLGLSSLLGPSVFLGIPAAMVLGGVFGATRVSYRCSDPHCGVPLERTIVRCPGCGGIIAGTIRRAADRLTAEEALPPAAEVEPLALASDDAG